MVETKTPKLTLVDMSVAQANLADLIQRSSTGEEIIITEAGKPVAMLASPANIQILANVGAIYYELPFSMGGHGWFGPSGDEKAKQRADEAYQAQFMPQHRCNEAMSRRQEDE